MAIAFFAAGTRPTLQGKAGAKANELNQTHYCWYGTNI